MIRVNGISKTFPSPRGVVPVLHDFSFTVPSGSCFGIAGKSGAGKSTLLSIIAGLQEPDEGQVLIDGTDIFVLDDRRRALFRNQNIGFVSQEQSFLAHLTVRDNVRLPAFLGDGSKRARTEERADQLLESLGIGHLADCYPAELSGGENHRVLIARALMNEPGIILADEPTGSLEKEQAAAVVEIFRALADEGRTVLMVSHDADALKRCDEIIRI